MVQLLRDAAPGVTDLSLRDDFGRLESGVRRHTRAPLPPQSFTAKRSDGGVLFTIIDRDPIAECNGAVRYDVYWAEDVDLTDADTIADGFARATQVESIPAPGKAGADASRLLRGERFLRGFYFCVGVGANLERSEPTSPISMNDDSIGGGYPDDVLHFSASESGEIHNGVPYSVVSFIYQAPNDSRFFGVKFFVKDYPVINEIYQTYLHRYTGRRGGTGQDEFKWEIGRRKGIGTLTIVADAVTGTGSSFVAQMNAGDLLEVRGVTQALLSVTDDTTATLAAAWSGDTVTTVTDWWIIPEVTIYAVSIGRDGSHRDDITAAPSVTLFLDGLVSPPVAPALTANVDANDISTFGGINRLEWDQLEGTEIKAYHLYRGTGAAQAFADCTHIATREHNPHALASGHHSYDDTDFTIVQKEQNQVFTYFLVAENWREQRSDPSTAVEVACRLNSPPSGDPTIPARSGVKNMLYNAALSGTAGNTVDDVDTTQDAFNNMGSVPTGWIRWESGVFAPAVNRPTHENNDQIEFTPPTAGGSVYVWQDIKAWTSATPIVKKGSILTFQALIKHGGVIPDGTFNMYVESLTFPAARNEYCSRRWRNPATDALEWLTNDATSILTVPVAELLSTWQMFFAVFRLDDSFADVEVVRVNWGWEDGTTGEIYVTQPMLSYGEELCNWTGEMIDLDARPPLSGDPVGPIGDGPGARRDLIDMQP